MSRMQRFDWRKRQSRRRSQTTSRQHRTLRVEPLEDRRLLAAVSVDNITDLVNGDTSSIANLIASDGGDGISLREALDAANNTAGADDVSFDGSLSGGTINLVLGQLLISDDVTVTGLGASNLTVDAGGTSRVLQITAGINDISGLTFSGGNVGRGGGIRNNAGVTTTLTDMVITGNTATVSSNDAGGGIWNQGSLTLIRSTLSNNSATGSGGDGGGIWSNDTVDISDSTLSGNTASDWGGGIHSSGTIAIEGSTLSGNTAFAGGGLFVGNATLTLTNSTLSGNQASYGGGLRNFNSTTTITHSSITANTATGGGGGGGIYVGSGTVTVGHSLVSGNTATVGPGNEIVNYATFNLNDFNLIGDSSQTTAQALAGGVAAGANDITATSDGTTPTALASILDTTLADNGGPTLTHALVVGSPAIDNGNPAVASPPANDQRGAPFVRQNGTIDIGAYEVQTLNLVVDTLVDESDGDYSANDLSLREALELTNANPGADTVTFDGSLSGTINLDAALGQLEISDDVTVTGPGADTITVDAGGNSRVLHITGGTNEISGLTISGGNEDQGGGIRNDLGATTTLTDMVVTGNTATINSHSAGGGIWNDGDLTITSSTISNNNTTVGAGSGAGIWNGENLTVTGSTITGNNSVRDGGGIYSANSGATLTITDSTISNNFAGDDAGGLFTLNGTIIGTTISGNTAAGDDGGGIWHTFETLNISHSTITGNSAANDGGGVFRYGGSVSLSHTLVSGNTGATGNELWGPMTLGDYNLIGDSSQTTAQALSGAIAGVNDITATSNGTTPTALASILDTTLADNGGPTQTHALVAGSPALDAGVAPIHLYRFEGDATDSVGANNGTLQGGLLADDPGAPYVSPTGVEFVDNSSQYVTLASPPAIGSTSSTIEAWVNIPPTAGNFQAVLSNFSGGPGSTFWGINTTGALRLNWNNFEVVLDGTTDLRDGQWHHIAYVRDTVANELRLYVDGELDASTPSAGTNAVFANTPRIGNSTSGFDPMEGTIDELGIYDQALSAEQIATRAGIFDQRGLPFSRVFGGRIDIGAYEAQTLSLVVDTLVDESDGDYTVGDLSLREALELTNANPGADTVTFAGSLSGTINLALGQLNISDDVTVTGPGADTITVDAGGNSRVLQITSGTNDVSGLTLTGGNIDRGGGIRNNAGVTTTLTDMVITGNTATTNSDDAGGGIWNDGDLTITTSTISNNNTTGTSGSGAGIWNGEDLTITGSTITGNSAFRDGGGIYSSLNGGTTLAVIDSTISSNYAGDDAGGIFLNEGTITNTTISGNTAAGDDGGGIWHAIGLADISHSTITGNSAADLGGGIYTASATTNLSHTLITGNTAATGNEIGRIGGTVALNDYNLIGDSSQTTAQALSGAIAGVNDITATSNGTTPTALASILDTTLADNGGPTQTHALVAGSPALDNGNPGVASPPANDQRGAPFVRQSGTIDIGAYELQTLNLVVDTLVDESDGDYSANDLSLREALELTNANPGADTVTFDGSLSGGTINLALGQLFISDDVTVTGVGADQLTVDAGGASRVLQITAGTNDISGLTISGGNDNQGGGIMNLPSATTTLTGMVISGNTATSTGYDSGGGINNSGNLTITGSTISGNSSAGGGGGLFNDGTTDITQSTFSGNTADRGGGVYTDVGSTMNITNTTISSNSANLFGGGVRVFDGTATITHSTIVLNDASNLGGGVYVSSSGTANLSHSIVSGNTATNNGNEIVNYSTVNLNDYNLIGDSSQTTAQALVGVSAGANDITATSDGTTPTITSSILIPTLQNWGGPTQTHALIFGSPALDAGDPTAVAGVGTVPLYDQRGSGFDRVVNIGGGALIDIGAYEAQVAPLEADLNLDGFVDGADFGILAANFGPTTLGYAFGNLNGDAFIDAADIGIMFGVWTGDAGPISIAAAGNSSSAPVAQQSRASKLATSSNEISSESVFDTETSTTGLNLRPVLSTTELNRSSVTAIDAQHRQEELLRLDAEQQFGSNTKFDAIDSLDNSLEELIHSEFEQANHSAIDEALLSLAEGGLQDWF